MKETYECELNGDEPRFFDIDFTQAVNDITREEDERIMQELTEFFEQQGNEFKRDSKKPPITSFRFEYAFLSNFFPCRVEYEGRVFSSAECAYQSAKCLNESDKDLFEIMIAPHAKQQGKLVEHIPNWNEARLFVMEEVLWNKFNQNPDLAQRLISTGYRTLVEGNAWGDTFWGISKGEGENNLGRLLMLTRSKLREQQS